MANTYYARIHMARTNAAGQTEQHTEVEVDARPSDAINLAVRFGAPMYVNRKIAESAYAAAPEQLMSGSMSGASPSGGVAASGESHADIAKSVRDTIANYEDPTGEMAVSRRCMS